MRYQVSLSKKGIVSALLAAILALSLAACGNSKETWDDTWDEESDASGQTIGGASELANTVSSEQIAQPGASGETWAVYWYLCGSDLESNENAASIDLEEMQAVELPEGVTVVIEAGGAQTWENGLDPDYLTRLTYDSNGLNIIDELPLANMGDPSTLEDFLRFSNENYPADNQAVIFWNHGGGSVGGVAYDQLFNFDSLTLPEMRQVFTNIGATYELIGFDACLMASVDVADTFDDYANWLVASEELEPGSGWAYTGLFGALAANPGINGGELGKAICDSYYSDCVEYEESDYITLSVVELSKTKALVQAYDAVGTEALVLAGLNPTYFSSFGRAARRAENYGGNNDTEGYCNMVDMGDLVRKSAIDGLLPISSSGLLTALEDAVYYQVKGPLRSQASGLSCYYNYNGDYEDYDGFAQLQTSDAFEYYFDYALTGSPSEDIYQYVIGSASNYTEESVDPQAIEMPSAGNLEDYQITIDDEGYAVLDLGAETAAMLSGVYFNLAILDEESGVVIYLGLDNDLDADWDNGIFKDNFRGVWGSIDGALVYMELSDEADNYQIYAVPILLNGEKYTLLVSYVFESETFNIIGARKGIDELAIPDKNIRPLVPGDVVEPLHYVMMDWENNDEIEEMALESITVSNETSFEETDLGDGDYFLVFEMRDMLNNSFQSEACMITVEDGEIYMS